MMTRKPLRLAATTALAGALVLTGSPAALAAEPAPSGTPSPPVTVDKGDTDLKLEEGAQLAPPKVLDIKTVVEEGNGDERREETNDDLLFALQAEVLFGKDSAKLTSSARSRIERVANEIQDQHAKDVKVHGFTDDLGSAAHGITLSRQRAQAVEEALRKELGSGIAFEVRGYGEQYPIADNSTEQSRKKNRRVEISFPKSEG